MPSTPSIRARSRNIAALSMTPSAARISAIVGGVRTLGNLQLHRLPAAPPLVGDEEELPDAVHGDADARIDDERSPRPQRATLGRDLVGRGVRTPSGPRASRPRARSGSSARCGAGRGGAVRLGVGLVARRIVSLPSADVELDLQDERGRHHVERPRCLLVGHAAAGHRPARGLRREPLVGERQRQIELAPEPVGHVAHTSAPEAPRTRSCRAVGRRRGPRPRSPRRDPERSDATRQHRAHRAPRPETRWCDRDQRPPLRRAPHRCRGPAAAWRYSTPSTRLAASSAASMPAAFSPPACAIAGLTAAAAADERRNLADDRCQRRNRLQPLRQSPAAMRNAPPPSTLEASDNRAATHCCAQRVDELAKLRTCP